MTSTFDNNLYAAAFLWAENRILQQLQAFNTITTRLYYTPDPVLPAGYLGYSAPLKQWVYDSGVSGAHILNEASGGAFTAYPLTRASGIHVDYNNGRVIVPAAFGTGLTLTGTYSYKQVNIYQPNETEQEILTQGKYFLNPRYRAPLVSGVPPYVYATPAVFLNPLDMRNDAFQLGGLVDSKTTMTMTVLAESNFQATAMMSLFRDARYQYFPMLNTINDPLDEWGDVKGGTGYNYASLVGMFGTPGNLVYIENVHVSKVSDRVKMNPMQTAAIIDLDLSYIRQAPIGTNVFV